MNYPDSLENECEGSTPPPSRVFYAETDGDKNSPHHYIACSKNHTLNIETTTRAEAEAGAADLDRTFDTAIRATLEVAGLLNADKTVAQLQQQVAMLQADLRGIAETARKALKGRNMSTEDDFTKAPAECLVCEMAEEIVELRLALAAKG